MKGTEALLDLLALFDRENVPYMLVGSFSSNFYGIPRSTKDADLVVHLPSSEWASLPSKLPPTLELDDQMSFEMVTSTRRELLRVKDSLFQIELFRLSDDDHDQERFRRRRKEELFPGAVAWLPTAEDVIIQKLRWCIGAKRTKDFDDVVAVIEIQSNSLDWDYISKWCEIHRSAGVLQEARSKVEET